MTRVRAAALVAGIVTGLTAALSGQQPQQKLGDEKPGHEMKGVSE